MSAVLPVEPFNPLPTEAAGDRIARASRALWPAAALPGLLVLGVTFFQLARGWAPTSDDAVIAIRAWDVLSRAAPLLGQATLAHGPTGQVIYDLGPLYYFALALPEHASPTAGPLLGAVAIWIAGAYSFVAAARSAYGSTGLFGASAVLLLIAWEVPAVITDPLWNPHAAAIWLLSASTSLLAVMEGQHRWYPFATFAASLAIQANVVCLAAIAVLWIVATLTLLSATDSGGARRRRLLTGTLVGCVCWAPTVVQQVWGRPGNLSQFLWYLTHHRTIGLQFGLKSLAAVVDPRIMMAPLRSGTIVVTATFIARERPIVGFLVLCLLALVAAWSLHRDRPERRLLAVVELTAICFVFTFGNIAPTSIGSVDYLSLVLCALACLFWILLVMAALAAIADLQALYSFPLHRAVGYALICGAGAMLVLRVGTAEGRETANSQSVVSTTTAYIQEHVPRGPVVEAVAVDSHSPEGFAEYADSAAVAWELRVAGWRPEIYGSLSSVFGATYAPTGSAYVVVAHTNAANSRVLWITLRHPH